MKPRHKRLVLIVVGIAGLGLAVLLVRNALDKNVVFFYTPTQVAANEVPHGRAFRIGGLVLPGSVKRMQDGVTVQFVVTDTARSVPVEYRGILPDLFREGKGVVTQGRLTPEHVFRADEVLAKHDENYMPPEAADALKRARAANDEAAKTVVMNPKPGASPR